MKLCLSLIHFWLSHPALFYGIAFLLGIACHLYPLFFLLIPCLSLWIPFFAFFFSSSQKILKTLILSIFIFLTGWGYTAAYYSFPQIPPEGLRGMAHIKIESISLQHTFFGERWLYRCELQHFFLEGSTASFISHLPCLLSLAGESFQHKSRPLAHQDYWIPARLVQTEQDTYLLKVSSKAIWTPMPNSWSLAEQRYQWKQKVTTWIENQMLHSSSAMFLAGLATGEFDDHWMRQQFARFGVQHLLAISGFHFAITASLLGLLFSFFLSYRPRTWILLLCLGFYCLFLGPQASVLRAWMMCSFTLIGFLIDKQTNALNSLGVALLGILGYNPLLCQGLGFQLSFAITAAILLFYQPALQSIQFLLPKRRLSEMMHMNGWNQHAYCLLAFLRQGLALTIAVNLFALPFTLYYFQQFPWMSLLYNLFFPFLASGSMCLLFVGGLCSFVPFIASGIHTVNSYYTDFLLRLTYQVPSEIDSYLVAESLDPFWFIFYFCVMTIGGIWWRERAQMEESSVFV